MHEHTFWVRKEFVKIKKCKDNKSWLCTLHSWKKLWRKSYVRIRMYFFTYFLQRKQYKAMENWWNIFEKKELWGQKQVDRLADARGESRKRSAGTNGRAREEQSNSLAPMVSVCFVSASAAIPTRSRERKRERGRKKRCVRPDIPIKLVHQNS